MIKIKRTVLGGIPRVAVSVSDIQSNKLIESLPVDILEIRVDQFKRLDSGHMMDVIKRIRKTGFPIILTVRSKDEGGQKNIPDKIKLDIFSDNISSVDAVDIELRSPLLPEVVKIARRNKKMVIVSWHDLKSTPDDKVLEDILKKAKMGGADIVKIAAKANSMKDVNRLMNFTVENRTKNLVVIVLGATGSISRLAFPGAGSLMTFAYINKPSGLGQISLKELLGHLRAYYPKYRRNGLQ